VMVINTRGEIKYLFFMKEYIKVDSNIKAWDIGA
jgi:hypothetical protein